MRKFGLIGVLMLAAISLSGCAGSVGALFGVAKGEIAPREAGMLLQRDADDVVFTALAACQNDVLGEVGAAAINRYGPALRAGVGGVATRARACAVDETGKLVTDPASGAICDVAAVRSSFLTLSGIVRDIGAEIDSDIGTKMTLLSIVAGRFYREIGSNSTSYPVDTPGVTLEEYDLAWGTTQASADALWQCVNE